MLNIFKVINMEARTLSLMIIFRWKSRDGSRRQAVSGGKSKIGQLIYTKARNFATRSNRRLGCPNDENRWYFTHLVNVYVQYSNINTRLTGVGNKTLYLIVAFLHLCIVKGANVNHCGVGPRMT